MKAELVSARFEPSSAKRGDPDMMWSEVRCSFKWQNRRDRPFLTIEVRQARDREATYAELERRAQDQAIAILREALLQLEKHSLGELDRPVIFDPGLDIED